MSAKSKKAELNLTPQERIEREHARHQRLMAQTGSLLEKALNHAVAHLGTGTQEVKKITRCNEVTRVELGPVATLDQVLSLYQAVRKLGEKQEQVLTALEPPRIVVHSAPELEKDDLKLIQDWTDRHVQTEIQRMQQAQQI